MTTRNEMTTLPGLFALATMTLLIAAGSASAEITIDGFDYWTTGSSPVTGTFNAAGADKLVVLVTGEHGFNQTANGWISGVTYDGVPMVELINRTTIKAVADDPGTPEDETVLVDDTWNAIYYLDYPATSTGLIEATVSSRGSMTVVGLSGTAPGAGNTVIGPRDSNYADLTTSAGSIVLASYGMGGSGNTAFINNVTVDPPLTFLSKQNNGGGRWWDGHVTAYANDVAAGTATYSVTDTSTPGADGRTGAHLVAAEFLEGIPHNLTLRVDPVTGDTTIVGDATRDYAIDYYQITSESGSLDSNSWTSLADQDYEGSGPPSGFGDGWEEAGGAGSHALAEAFLLGTGPIGAGESVGLGQGYDTDVDGQDLLFKYRTEFGKIIDGLVEYATSATPGDANLDGIVDAADYVATKTNLGMAAGAKYADGDFDLDGDVDWDDMGILRAALGQGGAAGTIPEPGSAVLLTCGLGWLLRRRRF